MGEAKRRKLQAQACFSPERREDIARLVRSIDFEVGSGTCFVRAFLGHKVLSWLSIASRITRGGMLYRAGPDEICDVLAFCGQRTEPIGPTLERRHMFGSSRVTNWSISRSAIGERTMTPTITTATTH